MENNLQQYVVSAVVIYIDPFTTKPAFQFVSANLQRVWEAQQMSELEIRVEHHQDDTINIGIKHGRAYLIRPLDGQRFKLRNQMLAALINYLDERTILDEAHYRVWPGGL